VQGWARARGEQQVGVPFGLCGRLHHPLAAGIPGYVCCFLSLLLHHTPPPPPSSPTSKGERRQANLFSRHPRLHMQPSQPFPAPPPTPPPQAPPQRASAGRPARTAGTPGSTHRSSSRSQRRAPPRATRSRVCPPVQRILKHVDECPKSRRGCVLEGRAHLFGGRRAFREQRRVCSREQGCCWWHKSSLPDFPSCTPAILDTASLALRGRPHCLPAELLAQAQALLYSQSFVTILLLTFEKARIACPLSCRSRPKPYTFLAKYNRCSSFAHL